MHAIENQESKKRILSVPWSIGIFSLITIGVLLAYANILKAPFVFDDLPDIRNNPHIRIVDINTSSLKDALLNSPCVNRPVANLSFALNYYVHEYNPFGFHVVNVVIHILNGFMLFWIFRITLLLSNDESPGVSKRPVPDEWAAAFAALLWALHPVQIQSVTYIVQRMTSLSTFFSLVALLCYLYARMIRISKIRWGLIASGFFAFMLALGTKEIAIILPAIILLYEWIFFKPGTTYRPTAILIAGGLAVVFLVPVAWIYLSHHPQTVEGILNGFAKRDFDLSQRLMTQLRVLIYYTSLIAIPLPSRFLLDYDYPLSQSLVSPPTTLITLLAHMALLVLAWRSVRREKLLSLAIVWFYLTLMVESSMIALEMAYEHRLYLPSMMIFLMIVTYAGRLAQSRRWMIVMLSLAAVLCIGATAQRNRVWNSEMSLWKDCVKKSPRKARAQNNLGLAYKRSGNLADAGASFRRSIELDPKYAEAYTNLGQVLAFQSDLEGSIHALKKAVELEPGNDIARNNLGNAYFVSNRIEDAMSEYQRALAINPYSANTYQNLGLIMARKGRLDQSVSFFQKAIAIDPGHEQAKKNLAHILVEMEKYEKAMSATVELTRKDPDAPIHYYTAACLSAALGKTDQAVEWLAKALERGYDNIEGVLTDPRLESLQTSEAFSRLIHHPPE